jgi:hypothetical protein
MWAFESTIRLLRESRSVDIGRHPYTPASCFPWCAGEPASLFRLDEVAGGMQPDLGSRRLPRAARARVDVQ